jgi:hypothetical protein
LPEISNDIGDSYIALDTGNLWVWTESLNWLELGPIRGPSGLGVAPGGTAGSFLIKTSELDYATSWSNLIDGGAP